MKVNLDLSKEWDRYDISKWEKHYNVKFVCETPIRMKWGDWFEQSSLIFYSEEPHPEGSNYMAVIHIPDIDGEWKPVITDGITATEGEIQGLIDGDEVYYSRFRHDYRTTPSGMFIDGGRDYTRSSVGDPDKFVTLKIIGDKLEIVNE
jgi:hypothetical protein